MTTLQIVFNAGALYEVAGKFGTMHLMEHLICKTYEDMMTLFTEKSIDWNAYTGDEHVVFHWSGLDSQLTPELKRTLVSRVLGDINMISQDMFDNEKSTVLQEYKDAFENPVNCKLLNIFRGRYNYYDAIGRYDDVNNFTLEDAKQAKKEIFTKPARIIEVGPTKTDFSDIEYSSKPSNFKKMKYRRRHLKNAESCPETDKTLVTYISKRAVSKRDYPYLKVACQMINEGLESPLYQEIRVKRGLSYFSASNVTPFINRAICMFFANTTDDKVDELKSVYEHVFSDITKYLSEERFDTIMSMKYISKDKQKILRYLCVDDLVRKDCIKMPSNLKKITYDKVVEIAQKYLNKDNMTFEQ